jgi:hypothetical protein
LPELPRPVSLLAVLLPSEDESVLELDVVPVPDNDGEAGPVVMVMTLVVEDKTEATQKATKIKRHYGFKRVNIKSRVRQI